MTMIDIHDPLCIFMCTAYKTQICAVCEYNPHTSHRAQHKYAQSVCCIHISTHIGTFIWNYIHYTCNLSDPPLPPSCGFPPNHVVRSRRGCGSHARGLQHCRLVAVAVVAVAVAVVVGAASARSSTPGGGGGGGGGHIGRRHQWCRRRCLRRHRRMS